MKTTDVNFIANIVEAIIGDNFSTIEKDSDLYAIIKQKTGLYNCYLLKEDPKFSFEGEINIYKYKDLTIDEPYNYLGQEKLECFSIDNLSILKHSGQYKSGSCLKGFCSVWIFNQDM